jgi:hypothetical protein
VRGDGVEGIVNGGLYRTCCLALAFLAVAKLWLMSSDFQFTYGQFWPSHAEPVTFGLFLISEVWDFLIFLGLWVLFAIRVRGGGRWWWRWWAGGLSAAWLISDLTSDAMAALASEKVFHLTTAYPWLSTLLLLLALPPIWILTGQRRAR